MGVILNAARSAARDDVLSVRDVGRLLSKALEDGKISHVEKQDLEKMQSELSNEISPAARRAIQNFLAMGDTFDGGLAGQVFGLTVADSDQLEKAGITRLSDLMIRSRTPQGRSKLATDSHINLARITNFAERADLARIVGVGNKYAAVLHGAGINNMGELANQDPAGLRRKILDFLKTGVGKAVTSRRPSMRTVERWIDRAKGLPDVMRYVGEHGPNFSLAAFNRLNKSNKALLISGHDVRLSDATVFEADNLKVSVPRRKPRAITDMIRLMEETGYNGDFESVHLSSIERVKAGRDTLGYRLEFDVTAMEEPDYEGASFAPVSMEGWLSVVLDSEGKVLDSDSELWQGGMYEG